MNDRDYCGDGNALTAFLYDECDPGERDAIAAHVAHCASCMAEIEALRLTRTRLAAWTPPLSALGFRVTQAPAPATVLTSPRWWSRPLPAWAQAAAAVAIFAGGLAVGARTPAAAPDTTPLAVSGRSESNPLALSEQSESKGVSQQDFDALRAEVARLRTAASPAAAVDEDAVLRRASTLVDERVRASEVRLKTTFENERAQLVRDFKTVLTRDLGTVQASVDGFQRVVGTEVRQNTEAVRYWDQAIRRGQVVPTSLGR